MPHSVAEIIPDVYAGLQSPSNTFTHEGNFGPLLFGGRIRSFYIRLEPGIFLAEHPHPTESLVLTVSGRWVLCSEGKRQVMEAGSTFLLARTPSRCRVWHGARRIPASGSIQFGLPPPPPVAPSHLPAYRPGPPADAPTPTPPP